MSNLNARLSIGFACVGHATMHVLAAIYLTIVLTLEDAWALPYDRLIGLWTVGSLLIGLGAPLAGWLGDRWGEARMMVVFYLLTGAGTMLAGLTSGPTSLMLALAVLGIGAAIYHPIGMSWIVRHAVNRGRAMGLLGVFGGVGVASAAIVAASLSAVLSWRAAFLIPGAIAIAIGVALLVCLLLGLVSDIKTDRKPEPAAGRSDVIRAFVVLTVTMVVGGLVFNSLQIGMPKWFETSMTGLLGEDSLLGVGGLVTLVYLLAAGSQVFGGYLSDRVPLKTIYVTGLAVQFPLLILASLVANLPLIAVASMTVFIGSMLLPAENLLLARYTPDKHRGLAYGLKFVLAFGVSPLAVQLVRVMYGWTGGFTELLWVLAGFGVVSMVAATMLPSERRAPIAPPVPAPAE